MAHVIDYVGPTRQWLALVALLDALAVYQAAQTARGAATTALIAALEKELDR